MGNARVNKEVTAVYTATRTDNLGIGASFCMKYFTGTQRCLPSRLSRVMGLIDGGKECSMQMEWSVAGEETKVAAL